MMASSTVLVIDDEPLILTSICRLIDDMDISLLTAASADEGLGLLNEHEIGVVLTDQCMPGMSGLEILKEVRANFPATVGILMSGDRKCQLPDAELADGIVYSYIHKPWRPQELIETITGAIKKHLLWKHNQHLNRLGGPADEKFGPYEDGK